MRRALFLYIVSGDFDGVSRGLIMDRAFIGKSSRSERAKGLLKRAVFL